MSDINMTSLTSKLQNLELCLKSQDGKEVGYRQALREDILDKDLTMEVEVLKSLGDIRLKTAKLSKDSAEFDKAAALYAAALLRCTDPDMGQTLEHRIGYMEKLSRQLLQGYTPHFLWLSPDYGGTADCNVLRVEEVCDKLDRSDRNTLEQNYTKTLVTAIANSDILLELEVLKSLGDFYMEAAAMYNKALTRCGDPEAKLTLEHRIKYTEKTREAVQRQTSWLAEKHFAAVLKKVHTEDPTAQQYQREVEPLCKLGEVYSQRGQQTGDGGDFVKAAALYNAAIARSGDKALNGNIVTAVREVEKAFLKCVLDINSNVSQDDTEKHKKQLKEMRDEIKLEMETIDQQLDPYVYDEDDPCVKEIEAKRAQAVRQLFENIAERRKEFICLLVEVCIGLMGPPPCKYALIGLGSQATGLVTPYSDLEFAILVEEEDNEECLVYFHNLTHYLHLKVVNLGETILPALAIKSLNDFNSENPLDNWYYDSVTPRGFAFDGSMPKASKTPLGRQGTMDKPPSELICTPENMASKLQKDVTLYLKDGYHLATILRNPCLIAGNQDLVDTYMAITGEILQADGAKLALQLSQRMLQENMESIFNEETISAKLTDVKKEIYRFPAVAVDCLALSSSIVPSTVWETIEEMENQQVISPNNAHHLTVLTSISAELRLRTYIANGGQKENLSALASMETVLQTNTEVQRNALIPVFHLPNEKQLFRYYYTAVPLKGFLQIWSLGLVANLMSDLYDKSPTVQGTMYSELCKYEQAIRCYHEALKKSDGSGEVVEKMKLLEQNAQAHHNVGDDRNQINYSEQAPQVKVHHYDIVTSLSNLGVAWHHMGNYRKAVNYNEQALEMRMSIYGQGTAHSAIALSLNNLGQNWKALGDYKKAISYHEKSLQMQRNIYGQNTAHPEIANSLNNLGSDWSHVGDYREAITYHEQALQMRRFIHGQSTSNAEIANSLNNLGYASQKLGDNRKAVSYHEQALQMRRRIYGQNTAHPDITNSLNNLGSALSNVGDNKKSISYCEQALQMRRSIYGQDNPHPEIANTLNNLGGAWDKLGDHRRAARYHEQALQMRRSIYGPTTAHPEIANSLNHLGSAWSHLGDYRKVTSHYGQVLEMNRSIYGQDNPHPEIANSLSNLGGAWSDLGDHRKAISYHEQALQMYKSIYGQNTVNVHIAASLNILGEAWRQLCDYRKAISYTEQALQMFRSIYGQNTVNAHIANSLNNLGVSWSNLGDYRKAIDCFEQALQMLRSIHGQSTANVDIATSLNNLGGAWSDLGDYRKAISYVEQALQMFRSIYGQSTANVHIALLLNNLGQAWINLGDYSTAINYLEQALQMCRSIYGEGTAHPIIATSLDNLGTTWGKLGDCRKAIGYHEQALQMNKGIYGQTTAHPDTASSLNNLAEALNRLGDYSTAIKFLEQVLQMHTSIYGQNAAHPHIATSLGNLGSAWYDLGDYPKAISYYEQTLQMRRSIYGENTAHSEIATSLNNLGCAWLNLGDYGKAISHHEQALQMRRSIHGQSTAHPDIANLLNNLGCAWLDLSDYRKAISYYEQTLQMYRGIHGQSAHHNIALSLIHLGEAWNNLGDYSTAINYYEQAMQMHRSIYCENTTHPHIATLLTSIGTACLHLRDYSKALTVYQESLDMTRQIYHQDQSHPQIKRLERSIVMICIYIYLQYIHPSTGN
ncbi:uncharacterized protein LOC144860370 [Branchiostoma floridae x Branchiostoma japonicum]